MYIFFCQILCFTDICKFLSTLNKELIIIIQIRVDIVNFNNLLFNTTPPGVPNTHLIGLGWMNS